METVIDWSKAPDWAIGHALHTFGGKIHKVWVGEYQYQRLDLPDAFPYGGDNSHHHCNATRSEFKSEQLRPAPWTGEGLPPVGTACEVVSPGYSNDRFARFIGQTVTVIAHDVIDASPVAVFRMPVDGRVDEQDYHAMVAACFRPVRTPEQFAAVQLSRDLMEADKKQAPETLTHGLTADLYLPAAKELIAMGWHKKVTP